MKTNGSKPPEFDRSKPVEDIEEIEDYFRFLIRDTQAVMRTSRIKMNFSNYTNMVNSFHNLRMDDRKSAWELGRDISGWIEYLSDMMAYVQKALLDAETDKISVFNSTSKTHDDAKVNRGDRYANQSDVVVEARKRRNALEALESMLDKKIRALDKMYYFCKSTWEVGSQYGDKNREGNS